MPNDPLSLLHEDHVNVAALFRNANEPSANLDRLAQQIAQALLVHTEIEEKVLYPAVRERARAQSKKKEQALVKHAFDEHRLVKDMLLRLSAARGREPKLKRVLWLLEKAVMLHVIEEEKIFFPDVRGLFDQRELEQIASMMLEIKAQRPAA